MPQLIKTGGSGRLTDLVSLGVLTSLVPRVVLDEAIDAHECREVRVRKLPAHVVVYLIMALCLYPDDDYEEVAEKLTGLLVSVPGSRWEAPTRGAITQARQRLGPEVLKEVFRQVARPAASEQTAGAWLGRWRLMAIDGFVLDLPDTEPNVTEFGKDHAGGYETAAAHVVEGCLPSSSGRDGVVELPGSANLGFGGLRGELVVSGLLAQHSDAGSNGIEAIGVEG